MSLQALLQDQFPNAMTEADFVQHTFEALFPQGFNSTNTVACVGICHDEATRSFRKAVSQVWGEACDLSSVAGVLFLGDQSHHSRDSFGNRIDANQPHYVIYAMPHISINNNGEVGLCQRPSRTGSASACGALNAFHRELANGYMSLELDPYDKKKNRHKQALFRKVKSGEIPSTINLAKLTNRIVMEDLKKMIALIADENPSNAETNLQTYAIYSGILIHTPDRQNFVWSDESYVVTPKHHHAQQPIAE